MRVCSKAQVDKNRSTQKQTIGVTSIYKILSD